MKYSLIILSILISSSLFSQTRRIINVSTPDYKFEYNDTVAANLYYNEWYVNTPFVDVRAPINSMISWKYNPELPSCVIIVDSADSKSCKIRTTGVSGDYSIYKINKGSGIILGDTSKLEIQYINYKLRIAFIKLTYRGAIPQSFMQKYLLK
jgi:hypothetical protein